MTPILASSAIFVFPCAGARGRDARHAFQMEVTPSWVTKNAIYRSSCNGVEIRISVTLTALGLSFGGRGVEPYYRDIPEAELAALVEAFESIGTDAEKFKAFVDAAG